MSPQCSFVTCHVNYTTIEHACTHPFQDGGKTVPTPIILYSRESNDIWALNCLKGAPFLLPLYYTRGSATFGLSIVKGGGGRGAEGQREGTSVVEWWPSQPRPNQHPVLNVATQHHQQDQPSGKRCSGGHGLATFTADLLMETQKQNTNRQHQTIIPLQGRRRT